MGFHCAGGAKQALQDITDQPDGCFREGHISVVTGGHWTYCADLASVNTNPDKYKVNTIYKVNTNVVCPNLMLG